MNYISRMMYLSDQFPVACIDFQQFDLLVMNDIHLIAEQVGLNTYFLFPLYLFIIDAGVGIDCNRLTLFVVVKGIYLINRGVSRYVFIGILCA